jgi:hypothetical protein
VRDALAAGLTRASVIPLVEGAVNYFLSPQVVAGAHRTFALPSDPSLPTAVVVSSRHFHSTWLFDDAAVTLSPASGIYVFYYDPARARWSMVATNATNATT